MYVDEAQGGTMARRRAEEAEETSQRIIAIATRHFATHGYASTSLEAVVQEAGVTRGALYHHFDGKQGLFEAVIRKIQAAIAERTALGSQNAETLWAGFIAGCHAWLAAASDPAVQKILIVDAPAVLGWERWLAMDAEGGASLLRAGLEELRTEKVILDRSTDALFHLLNGAMNQAVLWIARSAEPQRALAEAQTTLEQLLHGLLAPN